MTDILDPAQIQVAGVPPVVVDPDESGAPIPEGRAARLRAAWRSMSMGTKLAAIWMSLVIFGAVFAFLLRRIGLDDPNAQPFLFGGDSKTNEGPSFRHWIGTDNLSRDQFSRIVHGGQVSMTVAFVAVLFGMTVGLFLGALAGFKRGWVETIIMATVDVILAFPGLILLLVVVILLDKRSLTTIALVVGFLAIPRFTRVARANALSISNREFVMAARAIGTKPMKILFKEVIPNVAPSLFGYALVYAAIVIALEGALAFLGLSVQPPRATWGSMLNEARANIKQTVVPAIWPALAFFFTILSLNTLGDWYRLRTATRGAAL